MKHIKKSFALILTLALMLSSVPSLAVTRYPSAPITPDTGNMIIGVDGSYVSSDIVAAINRINEIREEACNEGLRYGSSTLIPIQYSPMRLTDKLTEIAKLRAAEAAVRFEHTRPNGKSCDTVSYDGMTTTAECLETHTGGSSPLLDAVNNWYSEKNDYLAGNLAAAGHYAALINPGVFYFGLSCFYSENTPFRYTVAAEFNPYEFHTEVTPTAASPEPCTAQIEVPISSTAITLPQTIKAEVGKNQKFGLEAEYNGVKALVLDTVWNTTDPSVAMVNDGLLIPMGEGTATLSTDFHGAPISTTVTVTSADSEKITKVTLEPKTLELLYQGAGEFIMAIPYNNKNYQLPDAKITYTSENPSIASVDSKGFVVAEGVGTTNVYATATLGNSTKTSNACKVTVVAEPEPTPTPTPKKKKANPIKASGKTVKVSYGTSKAFARKSVINVSGAKGSLSFNKVSGNKKITVSKNGKITVKKGLAGGKTYPVKVKVRAAGNSSYMAGVRTVTVKIKVTKPAVTQGTYWITGKGTGLVPTTSSEHLFAKVDFNKHTITFSGPAVKGSKKYSPNGKSIYYKNTTFKFKKGMKMNYLSDDEYQKHEQHTFSKGYLDSNGYALGFYLSFKVVKGVIVTVWDSGP